MMVPANSSTPGAVRNGFAPNESTLSVTVAPFVMCRRERDHLSVEVCQRIKHLIDETVYAAELPAVTMAPAMSSRYLAVAAIMARALSLDSAWRLAFLPVDRRVRRRIGS